MTPERINDLRKKVLNNEPLDEAEYAQAVREMVANRIASIEHPSPKGKAKTTKASTVSLDDLLPS